MANKQEVLDSIAAKNVAVTAKLQELKDQIANGSAASPADLDEIIVAVNGIPQT